MRAQRHRQPSLQGPKLPGGMEVELAGWAAAEKGLESQRRPLDSACMREQAGLEGGRHVVLRMPPGDVSGQDTALHDVSEAAAIGSGNPEGG